MDICLSCFDADDLDNPPDFSTLRDQLIADRERIAPMLLKSPKFPEFLNAMLLFTNDVCEQVLRSNLHMSPSSS